MRILLPTVLTVVALVAFVRPVHADPPQPDGEAPPATAGVLEQDLASPACCFNLQPSILGGLRVRGVYVGTRLGFWRDRAVAGAPNGAWMLEPTVELPVARAFQGRGEAYVTVGAGYFRTSWTGAADTSGYGADVGFGARYFVGPALALGTFVALEGQYASMAPLSGPGYWAVTEYSGFSATVLF